MQLIYINAEFALNIDLPVETLLSNYINESGTTICIIFIDVILTLNHCIRTLIIPYIVAELTRK